MEFTILENHVDFVRNGANIKQLKTCNTGIPITRIETLSNGVFNFDKLGYANILDDKYQSFYLEDNDVLLSHINSAKFVGRSVIYKKSQLDKIIHGMNLLCIRFIKDKYLPDFFVWYTKSKQAKQYFVENTKHAVNQASITSTAIKQMPIPNVDISTQVSITNDLNNINAAISLAKERLLALDELVKSRFIEMFGELDLSAQKSNWERLSELGTIYTGTTPSTSDESNWDGDILWITPAEMNEESFFISDTVRKITEKGAKSKSLTQMPIGTVLLSTRAPIGKVGIVAKPMTCNQGFKNLYCPDKLNSIYLYVLLKYNTQYLNSIGTGTTFKEISKTTCGNIRIPVPAMDKQNEFAEFVKLIDKSKFVCQFIQGTFYAKFARFRPPP